MSRCRWAIKGGTKLTTRCFKDEGHVGSGDPQHEGKGLEQFPYQRWEWFHGDRRNFQTDRDDEFAWEEETCDVRSSITGVECLLPKGHPMDSAVRFHRYPRPITAGGGLE